MLGNQKIVIETIKITHENDSSIRVIMKYVIHTFDEIFLHQAIIYIKRVIYSTNHYIWNFVEVYGASIWPIILHADNPSGIQYGRTAQ